MSEFHRMITYLYLYEQEIKRHNVGFSKIEKRDQQCLVEIHMKNTGQNASSIPVYFYAQNQQQFPGILLGNMGFSRGNGDFKTILKGETLMDSGYTLDDVKGIYIPLSEQIMFVSQWDDTDFVRGQFSEAGGGEKPRTSSEYSKPAAGSIPKERTALPDNPSEPVILEAEVCAPKSSAPEVSEPKTSESKSSDSIVSGPANSDSNASDSGFQDFKTSPSKNSGEAEISVIPVLKAAEAAPKFPDLGPRKPAPKPFPGAPPSEPKSLPENWNLKWEFILENYPVMTPFANDENTLCVRLELRDIRLLPKHYWYLGNNSFLLHGFFNYRYLILGMTEQGEKKRWFIGIPGVFQNPERVMASLFGFPEFRNEKSLPVNTGEFGYWYRYLNE